jgi:hypothetical protein
MSQPPTPAEAFVAMCEELRKIGATRVAIRRDGVYEAEFAPERKALEPAAPRPRPGVMRQPTPEELERVIEAQRAKELSRV